MAPRPGLASNTPPLRSCTLVSQPYHGSFDVPQMPTRIFPQRQNEEILNMSSGLLFFTAVSHIFAFLFRTEYV